MSVPQWIHDYLKKFAGELGDPILQSFPVLQQPGRSAVPSAQHLTSKTISGASRGYHRVGQEKTGDGS